MAGVARAIQDKISSESIGKVRHYVTLDTPPNCLSINRDCSQVVVAGRSVFKIFAIKDDCFEEEMNLRAVRHPNLNYCTSDVSWNPGEEHVLASASTNGVVVIWNLHMKTVSKQEKVLNEHKRTVTRVNFHRTEHNLLISGSLDGQMKLFDIRKKEVSLSFDGKSDAVRDVQFNPHHCFQFATAFDSGNVQVWDIRCPKRIEKQFTAHNGPCFSLDWHPEDSSWLASAGRDKIIKIWDMQVMKPRNLYQVQTITSVAQIKWRPQRRFHIASCAFILDYNVNVWDIRRPYIPFAAFEDHKDVVTGIVWKPSDPHIFFSSSKDCTLYQHIFKDAVRPADKANPVALDISVMGDVALATNEKLVNTGKGGQISRIPSLFRRLPERMEQFTKVTSICQEFCCATDENFSIHWMLYSAKKYKLTGMTLAELCDHNATVAAELGRYEIAQTWRILQLLYGTNCQMANVIHKQDTKDTDVDKGKADKPITHQDTKSQTDGDSKDRHLGDTSTGVSEDESDAAEGESDQQKVVTLASIASGLGNTSHSDLFFGDGAMDQGVFDYGALDNINDSQDWQLPCEAFQPRVEIDERTNSPDPITQGNTVDSPSSINDGDISTTNQPILTESSGVKQEILGCPPFNCHSHVWSFTQYVCDMLYYYAEKGDVQMCVTVMIVLGDKIQPHIDDVAQEQWLMSYIDLLSRFQLWCQAAEVMKLCNHPRVSIQNQQSTLIHTNCSKCNKPLLRGGWLCDRCKGYINTCSICHLPVRGLYVWCQGCSHGGHLQHMKDWLTENRQCPAGCGHICEFSN